MSRNSSAFRRTLDQSGMLVVFVLLFIGCAVGIENFFSAFNMKSLLLAVSTIGIVSCGMLFCLASGVFDLSVGSVAACAGVVTAWVALKTDNAMLALGAGLGVGALAGLFNGLLVARLGMNAFIATLGTMQILRGTAFDPAKGNSISVGNESLLAMGSFAFPTTDFLTRIGCSEEMARHLTIQMPIWICGICFLIFGFLLERTTFGRNTLAIGGNLEAARLAGVPVRGVRTLIFVLTGMCAALAGAVLTARLGVGDPKVAVGLELDVITACVLGGVSLSGGVARVSHVIAGVLIMGTYRNAMNLLNVETFHQYKVSGAILLAAVGLDLLKQRKRN